MTDDHDVEELLSATFRGQESRADARDLSSAVRRRIVRRRRSTWIAAGALTLAVLVGGGTVLAQVHATGQPYPWAEPASGPAAPGWRWESSAGVEIQVPVAWRINEAGCHSMTPNPTVIRGVGAELQCLDAEPPTKEIADFRRLPDGEMPETLMTLIDPRLPDPYQDFPRRDIRLDGVPATRGEGRLADGRFAGWVIVPSRRIIVVVRTLAAATTAHILDSFRVVEVDHLGCITEQPQSSIRGQARAGRPHLAGEPVVVCYYGGGPSLESSTRVEPDAAAELLTAVNGATAGRNPDAPASRCLNLRGGIWPDVIILAGRSQVRVVFGSCVGRGITDGARWSQLTVETVDTIMRQAGAGYTVPLFG